MPDTYLILCGVALLAFALTYWITPGSFSLTEQALSDGGSRSVIDPQSFQHSEQGPKGLPLFGEQGQMGLLNLPFEGMVSGDRSSAAIGVFAFILITGGAFGILMATGSINRALMSLISRSQQLEVLAVPILFIAFSLGGAIFGMGEEVIPFVLIVVPAFLTMGFDRYTALLCTYVATQIGFACSWMNPFSVSVAQGLAGVPLMSGLEFRVALWCGFTLLGLMFTWHYSQRIRVAHPNRDAVAEDSAPSPETTPEGSLSRGDYLVLLILGVTVVWMVWGVTQQGYYLPEIATQFFTMGVAAAIVGCVFGLNGMTANASVEAFREGAAQLLPAALVVAFAKGVVLMLGGGGPEQASVLNTLLFHASQALSGLSDALAACVMFLFQSLFNFFVTSGSGQAALTMPIMAPLADLVGVSRQIAVLAFQLGDGLTNILVPTSAALMGCLGAARVEWSDWIKFVAKPMGVLFALSVAVMALAVMINFQ